jgi:hypothetical protein
LPHDTTIHTTKPLRASARSTSVCLAVLQTWSFQLLQPSLRDSLLFYPTQRHCVLSFALRRTTPTHLDTTPPFHSIPIGPASAAGRPPSSRCIESAPEHHASILILPLMRASDTALRLRDNFVYCVHASTDSAFHVRPQRMGKPKEIILRCLSLTKCHHHVVVASIREHAGVGLFVPRGSCCERRFAKGRQVSTTIAESGWDERN